MIEQQTVLVDQSVQSKSSYTYDAYGRVINQKNYSLANTYNEVGYTYTGANLTAKTTYNVLDADGALVGNVTEQYGYDAMGRMTSVTDGAGYTTRTTYDSRGRVTSVTSPEGRSVTYVYDPVLNTVTETASGMAPIKYSYNALGLLVSETLPTLGVTRKTNTYDNRGRLVSESNAAGTTSSGMTYYTYDVWDRLIQKRVTNAAGVQLYSEQIAYTEVNDLFYRAVDTTITSSDAGAAPIHTYTYYNPANELVAEGVYLSDGATYQTDYYYNHVSNVVSTISPLDPTGWQLITNSYNTIYGQPTATSVKSLENSTSISSVNYGFDMLGRIINVLPGDNTLIFKTYDSLNRQLTERIDDLSTGAYQAYTKYVYDGAGRVIKELTANNAAGTTAVTSWKTVEYAYDKDGNLTDTITYVDSLNKQYTHYVYDTAGNLTHEYSGMSSPWTSTMSSSAYKLTTYTYDNRGRLTRLTDGLGQSETYTYDNNDNLVTKTLRDGKQERYTYNALGLVVTDAVYASATATTPLTTRSYTYYPTGALKSVTENGVTLTYTYDERGNVLTESDGTSTKTYTYNIFGGRYSYSLAVNNIETASEVYIYNAGHRLTSVLTDNVVVGYTYDMRGNRVSDVTYDRVTGDTMYGHNYSFDAASRVTQVQGLAVTASNTTVVPVSETYTYNLDGSMRTKNDAGVTTTYAYDGAGRLTNETKGTSVTTYAYDAANNRTSMYKDGVTTTYTYDANNRLLTEVKGSQVTNYTYDANGNQLSGNGLITYDARGRQSTWTDGITTASYTYYPNDLRKSKTVGTTTANFVWDGQNMVYEYNGTNTTGGTAYYYGLTLISQGNYAYYLYNGHGDVVQLVTSTGTLGRSYDYDAFGNEVNPSATDTNPFRYAGQYFDSETGTYYLRARYYDPGIGRFTQQDRWAFADPSDPLSLNLYTYCWNDPIKYYDPWGNDAIWLQYDQAAFTMGHTGLLLQDSDGAWFLFYWGTSHTLSALNPFKNQELIPKQNLLRKLDNYEFDTENAFDSVITYLKSMTQKYIDQTSGRNLYSGITDALYFEGDFTESVEYLNEMIGSMADQEALYNLYTNNCLQVSMDALAKGTFDKHNKYYQYAIQYARASLIPNDAFRGMRHFANTIDEYMRMSTWKKLVSATPYAYFNNLSKLIRGFPWLFG